jgi:hypothetical protein
MKKYFLFILLAPVCHYVQAQTNTFPSSGNVGIGTSSPNANTLLELKKEVQGALGPVLRLTGGGFSGAQCAIDLATYDPGTALPACRIITTDANFGCNLDFQTKIPGDIGNTLQSRLYVTSNGNVGIGTTSPQAKLAVNGDIYSKKVKVTQTGWPDYVFQSTYRLRPLSEIEQYIQQYHHLPEVPSAEEVEKNGLDLGENQAGLLQKIEELTLYIISLNKEVEALKKEIGCYNGNIQK